MRIKKMGLFAAMFVAGFSYSVQGAEVQPMTATREKDVWVYKVSNPGQLPISLVTLYVEAPFKVVGTPKGWKFETDGCSQVSWQSLDGEKPFPNDIVPGANLSGFKIKSAAEASTVGQYAIQPWDLQKGEQAEIIEGRVLVPGVPDGGCAHD